MQASKRDMTDSVTYWESIDSGTILATKGGGIFVWFPGEGRWIRLNARTARWDFFHQKIYWAHRASPVEDDRIGREFPALPDPPPEQEPLTELEEKQLLSSFPAQEFPRVAAWLKAQPGNEVVLFVVLEEDDYERLHGDGCFRHLLRIVATRQEADRLVAATPEMYSRHTREARLKLRDETIEIPKLEQEDFDTHSPFLVLRTLESEMPWTGQGDPGR